MARTLLLGAILIGVGGCITLPSFLDDKEETAQVSNHPFSNQPAKPTVRGRVNYAPAAPEIAMRVDRIGRELVQANPQAGLKQATMQPFFATISTPEPEIFHRDGTMLYITDGLVQKCPEDRQLAAVLAAELGKMISEREAAASRRAREPSRMPPISLPIAGNGNASAADPIYQMEVAKFENVYPKHATTPPPDPDAVARKLLEHAGYHGADFDAAQPLLQEAERNCTLERQLKGTPASTSWRP